MRLRTGGLWQNADFMRLWAGETISVFGSQITALALPLTAVVTLEATASQVGFLEAIGFAPYFVITLFAGVWVDRYRRRPMLVWTNLGQGLLLGLIPLAAWLGALRMELLYAVAFLAGLLHVMFQMAYQAYLPTLVERDHLVEGNSKLQLSVSAASVGGPGLAGLLVEWVTAPLAMVADSLSFLAAARAAARIRRPEPAPAGGARDGSLWRGIGQGLRTVLFNPYLRAMLGEAGTYNIFGTAIHTLFVLYAVRELGIRPGLLGLMYAAGSAGSILGSLAARPLVARFGVGTAMTGTYLVACASPLLIPLATGVPRLTLALLAAWLFLSGVSVTMSNIQVISMRQAVIPPGVFGRTNAAYRFFASGGTPLGALAAGALGDALGLRPALTVVSAGMLLALPWVLFSPLPRLRTMPDAADVTEGPPGGGAVAAPVATADA